MLQKLRFAIAFPANAYFYTKISFIIPQVTSEKMKKHRTGDDDVQNYKHEEDDRENATEIQDICLENDNECGEYDTGGGTNDYLHPENQEDEYYDFDGYDGF